MIMRSEVPTTKNQFKESPFRYEFFRITLIGTKLSSSTPSLPLLVFAERNKATLFGPHSMDGDGRGGGGPFSKRWHGDGGEEFVLFHNTLSWCCCCCECSVRDAIFIEGLSLWRRQRVEWVNGEIINGSRSTGRSFNGYGRFGISANLFFMGPPKFPLYSASHQNHLRQRWRR